MNKKKDEKLNQPFSALKELKKKMEDEERAKLEAKKKGEKPSPVAMGLAKKGVIANPPTSTSEDDALAFHRMMTGVVPLEQAQVRVPKSKEVDAVPAGRLASVARETAAQEEEKVHAHLRALIEDKARFEVTDDGRRVEGRRVDLSMDMVRKLRRGQFPVDATLDLHGLRAEEANEAVHNFLRQKRASGERCLLIVHGKGEHTPRGVGVLRGEMSAWLSQGKGSDHVAAFSTATPDDGGEGAIYVLLRDR
jgi:DNA-nicking Smr family endonuclease